MRSSDGRWAPSGLASVYRDHVDFVVRMTRALGVREAQVEDVVHEVFIVVHRKLDQLDPTRSVRGWLYGITRRAVLHHRRSAVRTARRELHGPRPVPPPDPEDVVARREAVGWIDEFLATLDPDKRLVFALCDIEGLSAPEVAEATGAKLNTVYSRLRAARRSFEVAVAEREAEARRKAKEGRRHG